MRTKQSSRKRIPLIPPLPRSKPPLPPLTTGLVFPPRVDLSRIDEGKQELPMYEVYRLTGAKTPYSYYFARRPSLQPESPTLTTQDDITPLEESESRRLARLKRRRTIGDATAIASTSSTFPSTTTAVACRHEQRKEHRTSRPRPVTFIEETENMKQIKVKARAQPENKPERSRSQSQTRSLATQRLVGPTSVPTPVRTHMHMSTTSVLLLPNLNTDSLWLNRPTRPRAKTNTDAMSAKEKAELEVDGIRQSSASLTATLVPTPPTQESPIPLQSPNHLSVPTRPPRPPASLYSNESTFRSICTAASIQDGEINIPHTPTSSVHVHHPQLHLSPPRSDHQQLKQLNQEKRRSKQRPASVATSMSFYSQKSYPHRLQLPEHVGSEELEWLVIDGDEDRDSPREVSGRNDRTVSPSSPRSAGRRPSMGNLSDGKSTIRSQQRSAGTRSKSRSRSRHRSRRSGGTSKHKEQEPSSQALRRRQSDDTGWSGSPSVAPSAWSAPRSRAPSVAPSAWSAPMSTSASRSGRTLGSVAPSAWSGSRSSAPSIAPSTSTSGSTSTTTSGWARHISEVQEDMKSFLDMSEDSRWCFSSSSGSESGSEPQTPMPSGLLVPQTFIAGNRISERETGRSCRDSTILPRTRSPSPSSALRYSPSLNPTLAYIVIGPEDEGLREAETTASSASPPPSPQLLPPSTASVSSTVVASEGCFDNQSASIGDRDEICEDYDYGIGIDVLVDHQQQHRVSGDLEAKEMTDDIGNKGKGKEKALETKKSVKEKENLKPSRVSSPDVYTKSRRSQSRSRARARREESVGLRSGHAHESIGHTGHVHIHAKGGTRMQARSVRAVRKKTSARSLRKDFGSRNVGMGVGVGVGVDADVRTQPATRTVTPGRNDAVGVLDPRLQPEYYGAGTLRVNTSANAATKARASLQKKRGLDDVRGVRPIGSVEKAMEKGKKSKEKKSLFGFLHVSSLFARI